MFWVTFPFKDCCMLLKSVKRLSGVQNTPRWWIHRVASTPLWWIHRGVDFLVHLEQNTFTKKLRWKKDQEVKTPHSSVFIPREIRESAGKSWLHGGEYTGKSIANTNNCSNIRKVLNPFCACITGLGDVVWWTKKRVKNLVTLSL
jgi:hypothetical protein